MNSIQQPASDVTVTLLTPKKHYQLVSGMRSFSYSAVSLLSPMLGAWGFSILGLDWVILLDMITFFTAFLTLLIFIKIPESDRENNIKESVIQSAKNGLKYLKNNRGFGTNIIFGGNYFTASIYDPLSPPELFLTSTVGKRCLE